MILLLIAIVLLCWIAAACVGVDLGDHDRIPAVTHVEKPNH